MSEAMREAFEALARVGNYVSVPYGMMVQFADDLDTIKAALNHIADAGEVVPVYAAMLTAAPSGDAKREADAAWIDGFPPCDGDGGICHIPLDGYPDFMAIAFNNDGSLVDGCGDDIGYELEDVEKWKPINACNLALTYQVTGARDMLREAAKQFRSISDIGHAAMCENHADELDRLRQSSDGEDSEEETHG